MTESKNINGSVNVELKDGLIIATYEGEMNSELVNAANEQIYHFLETGESTRILYNTINMKSPAMKLALKMKSFDNAVKDRVTRSATVVPGATTALMASIAFVLSTNHKVFHNDLDGALNWLNT